MAGVVDVTADSEEDDIAGVVDVISDSGDDDEGLRVRSGAPPLRFHGYRRGRELGQGSSGKVFVCSKKGGSSAFAAKAVDLRRMQMSSNVEREHTALCREVDILKSLPPHPNIVRLVDAFEEGDWFLLILELVGGGDLYTVLTSREPARLHEQEATFVLRQLADGLTFLHGRSIIHRDLKLENVLVASERRQRPLVWYTVKITDFGLSKAVGSGLSMAHSLVGTHPYTAPEVLGGSAYDFSSDLWCLGVLLYVLLTGHFPFDHIAAQQEELDILMEALDTTALARSIVAGLLQLDPKARLTLEAIYQHEWLAKSPKSDALERPLKRPCLASRSPLANQSSPEGPDLVCISPAGGMVAEVVAEDAVEFIVSEAAIAVPAESQESGGESAAANSQSPQQAALRQQSPRSSGVGEWLAHIYNASRGGAVVRSPPELPPASPATGTRSAAGSPVSEDLAMAVGPPSRQPDVMQVHTVVPGHIASHVLGKGGMQMRQMAATVGCKLRVLSQEGLGGQLLLLLGNYNQCVILQELVHGRIMDALRTDGQTLPDHAEVVLMVRAEAAGVVIGKQGFMLKQIRERSGSTISLLREQVHGQRPCILSGTLRDVLRAERHVFDLVRAVAVADPARPAAELPDAALAQVVQETLLAEAGEGSPT